MIPLLLLVACSADEDPVTLPTDVGCEDLDPRICALPFPSDRYLAEDPDTVTGWRLAYEAEALPVEDFDLSPYERLDGFSPNTQVMAVFEVPPDLDGVASWDDIGRSLDADHPTVILDLETGERIAHWVELDARAQYASETTVYLRLASRLDDDRAYGVAFRGLSDLDGEPLVESATFQALRDDTPTTSEELEGRRGGFEELFAALDGAGVAHEELQLAWRFHTASFDAVHRDLLEMRRDALERLGADGVGCTVTSTEEDYGDDGLTWRRIRGTVTTPSYMDSPEPPAAVVRGEDGLPAFQEWAEVPFTVILPRSLVEDGPTPGPLVTFGHGLMGTGESHVSLGENRRNADRVGAVMVATDWAGMSEPDAASVGQVLVDISDFHKLAERLEQGMINQVTMTRSFLGVCRDLPELAHEGVPLIDETADPFFVGVSEGGIYGGTLVTISPDIERGALLVNGGIFPFMIERSTQFVPYLPIFEVAYPERLDQALLLPLAQHLWDFTDPAGWLAYTAEGVDGIGPKGVLSVVAVNDAQVPNLSSDMIARMAGLPVIAGSAREPWGLDVVEGPVPEWGYVSVDYGDAPHPDGNLAPEVDEGGHWYVPLLEGTVDLVGRYMRDGVIEVRCDGVCDPD